MIKILYVIDSLAGGGAEKLLNDLLPLSMDFTTDILILSEENDKYSGSLSSKGIKVECIPKGALGFWNCIVFIQRYIINGGYDIVHANLFPITYYCSIAKRLTIKKFPILVMTEHSTDNRRRHNAAYRPVEKWIYEGYDSIIAISNPTKSSLELWIGKKKINDKCVVIENGIELDKYTEAKAYGRLRVFPGIKNTDKLLCMVGSIKPIKNHKQMIEILTQLPNEYKLIIVGEGPQRKEIETLIRSKGIDDRVRFLGFRSDIPEIVKSTDVVVAPSKWEGFGLVAVEAMACGVPVVVSNVPGLSDVVDDGGLLAETTDQFVKAITLLFEESFYMQMKENAFNRARQYSIDTTRRKYENLYKILIAETVVKEHR